jgi:superfamily II DNA/RNA helicase
MIFCNTLPSCIAVERTMFEADIRTVQYHGDMTSDARADAMRDFIDADADENLTMVCTDLAARGLDFGRVKVDHVVNFDFPMNSLDYIHRSGRTARAGAGGKVTNLVAKKGPRSRERDRQRRQARSADRQRHELTRRERSSQEEGARRRAATGALAAPRASSAPRFATRLAGVTRGRRGAARFETNDGSAKKQGARPRRPGGRG